MASSNKTPNLFLPQWTGKDKPKKDDFNDAFEKIDNSWSSVSPGEWHPLTLESGNVANNFACKRQGDIVSLRGYITGIDAGQELTVLPEYYRPNTDKYFVLPTTDSDNSTVKIYITTAGVISVYHADSGLVFLDSVVYII